MRANTCIISIKAMEEPVRVSCPHCPPEDPLQHLLETTSFYGDVDSEEEEDERGGEEEGEEEKKDVCRSCFHPKHRHPPPYGPWCSYNG